MEFSISNLREWNRRRKESRKTRQAVNEEKKYESKYSVLGIIKNESFNIVEWVEHYIWQGAGNIYLIDNDSDDDGLSKIDHHIKSGIVKVIFLPEKHKQLAHYNTAIDFFEIKSKCQWLMIADADEFWFCKDGKKISEALNEYNDFDLIYVNWSIFGSGQFEKHPNGLRKNLIYRQPKLGEHKSTKYLVKTSKIISNDSILIHKVTGVDSSKTISDNERFQINHYVTQSVEYFTSVKMKRGDVNRAYYDESRNMEQFNELNSDCTVRDELLARSIK